MNAPTNTANLAALRSAQAAPREAQLPAVHAGFFDMQSFELMQRVSKAFASSDLVPKQYQGNLPNTMIAMDMAQRIGANPLMVMQNLYIVHGTPGWSSKFLIATINASGRYSSLRYEWRGKPGDADYGCRAWAIERETGERLDGIWVDWKMVRAEGWDSKNGSKWKTMPDQMFVYRAAAFWQRAYAPELGMGLQTVEEVADTYDAGRAPDGSFSVDVESLRSEKAAPPATSPVDTDTGEILDQQQDGALRAVEQAGQSPAGDGGPTFEDAAAAVKAGDFDLARELSEGERKQIDAAIQNRMQPADAGQRQRRERGQGGLGIE